jgi:NAD-dependent dihydropyrimidine dehydrogenase PreA subunit
MLRTIIQIDEAKCDGCGLCAKVCHEGAIRMVDGKARLANEQHCDGLGACIGECPRGAITTLQREVVACATPPRSEGPAPVASQGQAGAEAGALRNWPVQLTLVSPEASWLRGADLLLAADCVPFAMAGFHAELLLGKALLIACPKLDDAPYYIDKLAALFAAAKPRKVTIARMEVPCCGGLSAIARAALERSGVRVPMEEVVIGIRGRVLGSKPL